MKLSEEGDFNNCISTVASIHRVDFNPFQTSLYFPITRLQIPASSYLSPRFKLDCHHTVDNSNLGFPIID